MKRQDRKRSSALRGANVLLLTLAVGLTACGDDDEGTDPTAGDEQSNPGDGNDDDGDGGEDDDPDPGDGDALNARIGNLTVGLDVTALDACVQTASDAPWQGPVLQAAGLEAVAAGELSEPLALELSETGRIRWVSGESDDCDTALAPSAEGDLAIESHREHSLLLFGAGDDLRRASFDNVVPETMDDGRFTLRSVRSSTCAPPSASIPIANSTLAAIPSLLSRTSLSELWANPGTTTVPPSSRPASPPDRLRSRPASCCARDRSTTPSSLWRKLGASPSTVAFAAPFT